MAAMGRCPQRGWRSLSTSCAAAARSTSSSASAFCCARAPMSSCSSAACSAAALAPAASARSSRQQQQALSALAQEVKYGGAHRIKFGGGLLREDRGMDAHGISLG